MFVAALQSGDRKEVTFMELPIVFLVSLAASVVAYYICKWLERHRKQWSAHQLRNRTSGASKWCRFQQASRFDSYRGFVWLLTHLSYLDSVAESGGFYLWGTICEIRGVLYPIKIGNRTPHQLSIRLNCPVESNYEHEKTPKHIHIPAYCYSSV